ncbi:MAG: aminomethyl-transferring glycine dehydrogenase subunit GcvPB [Desulfurococcales archaeon]|nr:aminomethyl-transferring glycine dehydrogenase subunit GcvPB [Desulfurococcales archaeon]
MSRKFRQAIWDEPLIFDLPSTSKETFKVDTEFSEEAEEALRRIPKDLLRDEPPEIPDLSEVEVVRHYTRLTHMSYGVDEGPVPLGSCTMKYNPKIDEELASLPEVTDIHPYQDEETVQGILEVMYLMQKWLAEITGTSVCSLQPPAGAAGELTGALIIRKYLRDHGLVEKDELIIPESAHGTNPASAVMAGFKVVKVPADSRGNTDLSALKSVVGSRTAGIMLTNPSTLGLFEEEIGEIADLIHGAGGLLYYDGANLNGILGVARPGDMGFDITHLNLHKTFAAPHGGGGPGAGAVCVKKELADYLPAPIVEFDGRKYFLKYDIPRSIGRMSWFYGNVVPIVKSFVYLMMVGPEIREIAEISVLNTNYLMKRLEGLKGVSLIYGEGRWRKHEVVISFDKLHKETGVSAEDVAKALLDRGFHAPTIYFPLIVPEAHMIELTETETKENIDALAQAYEEIVREAYENPEVVKATPRNTSVGRLDVLKANHPKTVAPTYKYIKRLAGQ